MPTRRRASRFMSWLAVMTTTAAVAACGSADPAAGPLRMQTVGGQPVIATSSVAVLPGQTADAEAYLDDDADAPVRITAVSVVSAPGFATARLVDVGVATSGHGLAAARGWPPPVPSRPAIGAYLPHGNVGLFFGITGPLASHDYAVAGLKIAYTYQGRRYSLVAWAGAAACVAVNSNSASSDTSCSVFGNTVNPVVEKLAGLST
jgi:hypothetical protein